jgi:hypothetical protein
LGGGCFSKNRDVVLLGTHLPSPAKADALSIQLLNSVSNLAPQSTSFVGRGTDSFGNAGCCGGAIGVGFFLSPKIAHAAKIVPNWTTLSHSANDWMIVHTTQKATTPPLCRPLTAIEMKMIACQINTAADIRYLKSRNTISFYPA